MLMSNEFQDNIRFFSVMGMEIYKLYQRILRSYYVPRQTEDTLSPFLHRFFDTEDIRRLHCSQLAIMWCARRVDISEHFLENFEVSYMERYQEHYDVYKYNVDIQALLGCLSEMKSVLDNLTFKHRTYNACKEILRDQKNELGDLHDLYMDLTIPNNKEPIVHIPAGTFTDWDDSDSDEDSIDIIQECLLMDAMEDRLKKEAYDIQAESGRRCGITYSC